MVYIIGAFCTNFGKKLDQSYADLTQEAYLGAVQDAGIGDGQAINHVWFGNCGMYRQGQGNIRGQVCTSPMVESGLFPERVPVINVENACATSSSAFVSACMAIQSGQSQLALVMGVEKMFDPATGKGDFGMFNGGIDQQNPQVWQEYYRRAGEVSGKPFELGPGRTPFMDTYAMQACYHMRRYDSTREQLAIAASNAHNFGKYNSRAQYRFGMTVEEVLEDRLVTEPLTRAMCAPMGDGAAATLVCSENFLRQYSTPIRARAIKVKGYGMAGGKYRELDEPGLSHVAGQRAYQMAGVKPGDIDLAEIHDATAFSHLYQSEMLGFCEVGQGGRFVESGATRLDGSLPLNTSGGLLAKGHPVGATGVAMICELSEQLRGEAGARQVRNARLALAENGGGVMGFDEAIAVVTILEGV